MTDLHVHILPGVDDGSPNLSTSLEMAEMAAQSGVRILAVTPHANQTGIEGVEDGYVNYESEQLEEQFYRLEREINREHIPISLVRGMEIMSIGPLEKNPAVFCGLHALFIHQKFLIQLFAWSQANVFDLDFFFRLISGKADHIFARSAILTGSPIFRTKI